MESRCPFGPTLTLHPGLTWSKPYRTDAQGRAAQRRKQIVGDCYQLCQDVDHYNDVSQDESIQLSLDFTYDVTERYIEDGIGYTKANAA